VLRGNRSNRGRRANDQIVLWYLSNGKLQSQGFQTATELDRFERSGNIEVIYEEPASAYVQAARLKEAA
jgi:hypothetical protein